MPGLTPLGMIHTAISWIAEAAGLIALARDQEISPGNRVGQIYVIATISAAAARQVRTAGELTLY